MRNRQKEALILVLLAGVGCGPSSNTVHVSGQVTFDGEPVEQGEITFRPVQGTEGPATGGVIKKGRYEVPANVGPQRGGAYRVEIIGLKASGRFIETGMGKPVPAFDHYIPTQFNTESTLEVVIPSDGSDCQQDFELES